MNTSDAFAQHSEPAKDTETVAVPDHIDFQLVGVEALPDSRKIVLHFERDSVYGLGLEFSQDVTASAAGELPRANYRNFQQKMFLGAHDSREFAWELPEEFGASELRDAATSVSKQARKYSRMPDGALIEFANIRHKSGWSYSLLARVRREWGAPHPVPPDDAVFSVEEMVAIPADTLVQMQLEITDNGSNKRRLGEPLLFKTARNQERKHTPSTRAGISFLIRWHAYGKNHPQYPGSVLVDLVDSKSGVIYHRFEHRWMAAAELSSPEFAPLPQSNSTLSLAAPLSYSTIDLIRAEIVPQSSAAVRQWWTLSLTVSNLGIRHGSSAPMFQLPSDNELQSTNRGKVRNRNEVQVFGSGEWSAATQKLAAEIAAHRAGSSNLTENLIRWGPAQGLLQAGVLMSDMVSQDSQTDIRLILRNASSDDLTQSLTLDDCQILVMTRDFHRHGLTKHSALLEPFAPQAFITLEPGEHIEFDMRKIQFGGSQLPDDQNPILVNTDGEFKQFKCVLLRPDMPPLESGEVTVLVDTKYAAGSSVTQSMAFDLHHMPARNLEFALQPVLKGRPIQQAKASPDDKTLFVIAYNDVLKRVQTFILVNDADDRIVRGESLDYRASSPSRAARSFFHACAIEEDEGAIAKLLSVGILAQLRGDQTEKLDRYYLSGTADPDWEQELRGDWPDKRKKIRQLVDQWNRFALVSLEEHSFPSSMLDGECSLSASFADAPLRAVPISMRRRHMTPIGTDAIYCLDSLPPWWPLSLP